MSNLMYAQMGLNAVSTGFDFLSSREKAKMQKIQQDYQNTMSALSAAQSLNSVTENEIGLRDAAIRAESTLQLQTMRDKADGEVAAAAAGVRGGSVKSVMRGMMRDSLQAKFALKQNHKNERRSALSQRRNILISKAFNKDISVIPRPSAASALLGLTKSTLDIWDSHQPEGQKISDKLAGWGR